ncbi:MAG: HAMP domain-containing sensor histidine kinase [Bacteroidota bacterium]
MFNKIFKYLKIENWTRLNKGNVNPDIFIEQRPNMLLSQFSVFGVLACLGHIVLDILGDEPIKVLLADSSFIIFLALFYILNEKGYHKTARYSFLIVMNAMLFTYGNLLPKESGLYLIFFPLIGGTYIFTSKDKFWVKFIFISLPIAALFGLEYFDYRLFGNIDMGEMDLETSFLVNLGLSTVVFSVAMNYLIQLNQRAENVLTNNNQKFKNLASEIEVKNKTLEKTNQELDRFAYSTSHDLRAPLLSVLGLINISKMETSEEHTKEYLSMMEGRVHNLDAFIKDITDYSRNSRLAVTLEPVDFTSTVNDILDSHKFNENASNITFYKEIRLDRLLNIDKKRLEVILNNLVNNAIKYHNIEQDHPEVIIRVIFDGNNVKVTVKDNGTGIPKHHQGQVFDMFFRASEQSQGSGLGLYIVKESLEKINGTIQVFSEPGIGTEFVVIIPAEEVTELNEIYDTVTV